MINRENYLKQIRPFINTELIKVFTGVRRCGKSVMLELIKNELLVKGVNKKQFIHLNFENIHNQHLFKYKALNDYICDQSKRIGGRVYIFLDEIQEVFEWEKCINSLRVQLDCDIYITGSNAKLLAGDLATYLSGRYVSFIIYPFSFSEFVLLKGDYNLDQLWLDYVNFGGMPFLNQINFSEQACELYLKDLFSSIILKDIISRHAIRDVDMLERLIIYMMGNIGRTFSANSIAKYFKSEGRSIDVSTLVFYLNACETAYLLYRAKRHDLIGKKILTTNDKYYLVDHGIREAIYGNNQRDIELILENIVYLELLRRGYKVSVGKIGDQEVDFVAEKQNERIYYQVCYILSEQLTIDREFSSLQKIKDNYPKYVISTDIYDMSREGIDHINIKKFLMKEEL